jgi:hypothetical protein
MAKDNWTNGGGDFLFSNPLNWSTRFVPVSSSTANINASGTYKVTSSANETVLAITTIPTATLDLTGGNFTALAGTGTGANAGAIIVENGAFFTVGGTVKNSGIITLNGAGQLTLNRDTILQGGGKITLSGNGFQNNISSNGAAALTNVDNTISGTGIIGPNGLVNENKGVIDANGSSYLEVATNLLSNAGLLEATSAGELILGASVTNTADCCFWCWIYRPSDGNWNYGQWRHARNCKRR